LNATEEDGNIIDDAAKKDETKVARSDGRKPSMRPGRKRARISKEESELSDLPEDHKPEPATSPSPKSTKKTSKGKESVTLTNGGTRKSSRKR
jgi:hypothetical protein